ncbi:energy transducer TonB [Massilia sp. DWR3-1-1]|uniref:energy transducer TonB n=1 Tax=Massilia sp. DWR3-1-1 TaxID=2804559 RepID=UPI003CEF9A03
MALLCVMCRVVPGAALVLALCGPAAAQGSGPTPVLATARGSCPAPIWPKKSLRNEETGTVAVAFLVGPDGKVLENKLARSSGYPLLDEASLQNNRDCRFAVPPAGEPAQWKTMELVWTLKEAPAAPAGGAGAPPPGASYFRDLGRVVTQIRVVDWTFDICASKHPHTSEANALAVRDWKARHQGLIDEMNGALQALPA